MTWQPPTLEEIDMSAEIGAYQDDAGDDGPPIIAVAAPEDQDDG